MTFEDKVRLHKDLKAFKFSMDDSDLSSRMKALKKLEKTKATNSIHFSKYDKTLMNKMIEMLKANKNGVEFKL